MSSILYTLFFYVVPTSTVSVKIDGVIDLGPNWNYKYTLKSDTEDDGWIKSYTQLEKRSRIDDTPKAKLVDNAIDDSYDQSNNIEIDAKIHDMLTEAPIEKNRNATKPAARSRTSTGLYTDPHKIKNDKANEFLKHIYKQSLTVFDSLKEKVNDYNLRRQIDGLSKNYQTKFRKFISETQGHTIRTRLGSQKVILNAIEVSSGLLKRLVSIMLGDLTKKGILRNQVAVNIVEKEVNNVINLEYNHACTKFKICRTGNTFSNFMTDILTILLSNYDPKLKLAIDALTETLKNNKFDSIMDENMTKNFHQGIEKLEKIDITLIKPFLFIIRSILTSKYKPLVITDQIDSRVNKTFAFLDIIEVFDKNLPGNEINTLEWNDIKNSLKEWTNGKRDDIVDIMQTLVDYFIRSLDRMDSKSLETIHNNLKYFLH